MFSFFWLEEGPSGIVLGLFVYAPARMSSLNATRRGRLTMEYPGDGDSPFVSLSCPPHSPSPSKGRGSLPRTAAATAASVDGASPGSPPAAPLALSCTTPGVKAAREPPAAPLLVIPSLVSDVDTLWRAMMVAAVPRRGRSVTPMCHIGWASPKPVPRQGRPEKVDRGHQQLGPATRAASAGRGANEGFVATASPELSAEMPSPPHPGRFSRRSRSPAAAVALASGGSPLTTGSDAAPQATAVDVIAAARPAGSPPPPFGACVRIHSAAGEPPPSPAVVVVATALGRQSHHNTTNANVDDPCRCTAGSSPKCLLATDAPVPPLEGRRGRTHSVTSHPGRAMSREARVLQESVEGGQGPSLGRRLLARSQSSAGRQRPLPGTTDELLQHGGAGHARSRSSCRAGRQSSQERHHESSASITDPPALPRNEAEVVGSPSSAAGKRPPLPDDDVDVIPVVVSGDVVPSHHTKELRNVFHAVAGRRYNASGRPIFDVAKKASRSLLENLEEGRKIYASGLSEYAAAKLPLVTVKGPNLLLPSCSLGILPTDPPAGKRQRLASEKRKAAVGSGTSPAGGVSEVAPSVVPPTSRIAPPSAPPLQCVEATLMALYLLQDVPDVMVVPLRFDSSCAVEAEVTKWFSNTGRKALANAVPFRGLNTETGAPVDPAPVVPSSLTSVVSSPTADPAVSPRTAKPAWKPASWRPPVLMKALALPSKPQPAAGDRRRPTASDGAPKGGRARRQPDDDEADGDARQRIARRQPLRFLGQYAHLVLGVYCRRRHLWGTIGLSRNSGLGSHWPCEPTLFHLVARFVSAYAQDGHVVRRMTVGGPLPFVGAAGFAGSSFEPPSSRAVLWNLRQVYFPVPGVARSPPSSSPATPAASSVIAIVGSVLPALEGAADVARPANGDAVRCVLRRSDPWEEGLQAWLTNASEHSPGQLDADESHMTQLPPQDTGSAVCFTISPDFTRAAQRLQASSAASASPDDDDDVGLFSDGGGGADGDPPGATSPPTTTNAVDVVIPTMFERACAAAVRRHADDLTRRLRQYGDCWLGQARRTPCLAANSQEGAPPPLSGGAGPLDPKTVTVIGVGQRSPKTPPRRGGGSGFDGSSPTAIAAASAMRLTNLLRDAPDVDQPLVGSLARVEQRLLLFS